MSVEQDQTNSGEEKRPVSRYQVLASLIEACDLGEGVDYSAITTLHLLHDWDDGSNFTDPGDPGRHLCDDDLYETFAHIWNTQEW